MKVPLSWLGEFCPVGLGPQELADLLSLRGVHVEGLLRPWEGLEGVIAARVVEVRDHPNSERLCLARVSSGAGERELVVGVRNMRAGDLVPLAGPGARVPALPEPLSAREIRGVVSEGMLCSPRELAISADHTSILILPEETPVGADLKEWLALDEVVLDVEIESNRGDLMSVFGVAREVAAATGVPLTPPDTRVVEGGEDAATAATVEVRDAAKCPRYLARVIRGVSVVASPIRAQARLTAAGMRPISNVVDATNYVMLEMGQPMHPFDLDLLDGRGVVVRRAGPGERLVTLDDVERILTEDDLVIADRGRPVGIAGVMGSATAEVSASTSDVLLESAYFDPRGTFRTYRRLMLQTEASARFSRGVDPELVSSAADRGARLVVDWGGGRILKGAADVGRVPRRRRLTLRPSRASAVLGYEVSAADAADALARLDIPSEKTDDTVQVEVPGHRPDLQAEIDLVEEVVRVQGYENLPSTVPAITEPGRVSASYSLRRRASEALVRAGLREAASLSFASSEDLDLMRHRDAVPMSNPVSAEEPFLRTSLIPGLVKAVRRNVDRGVRTIALFEVGHVFRSGDPVEEREFVAGAFSGTAGAGYMQERRDLDFFDAKGAVEGLMDALSIRGWRLGGDAGPPFHPGRSGSVLLGEERLGELGEIHPRLAESLEIPGRPILFELDLSLIARYEGRPEPYRAIPRFPPVRRDLAFIVDVATRAGDVEELMRAAAGGSMDRCLLFDVFEGDPIPAGKKSLAFSVEFRAADRTLTADEVDRVVAAIARRLATELGAELRTE